jgi:hypothetical protein
VRFSVTNVVSGQAIKDVPSKQEYVSNESGSYATGKDEHIQERCVVAGHQWKRLKIARASGKEKLVA